MVSNLNLCCRGQSPLRDIHWLGDTMRAKCFGLGRLFILKCHRLRKCCHSVCKNVDITIFSMHYLFLVFNGTRLGATYCDANIISVQINQSTLLKLQLCNGRVFHSAMLKKMNSKTWSLMHQLMHHWCMKSSTLLCLHLRPLLLTDIEIWAWMNNHIVLYGM